MRVPILVLAIALASAAQPAARKAIGPADSKTHKTHVHGIAKLSVALDSPTTGAVDFESAAHAIVGFEYEAKSAADKKKVEVALATVRKRFIEMLILPRDRACALTPTNVALERDGSHSEVHGEFKLTCAQSLGGVELRFGFYRVFPGIEQVEVQLISDKQQSSTIIKRDKGTVAIAP